MKQTKFLAAASSLFMMMGGIVTTAVEAANPTPQEASRFLQRATFGPTEAEITALTQSDYATWINSQFSQPLTSHVAYLDKERPAYLARDADVWNNQSLESAWAQAVTAPDALRQRVTFALLNFFIVSFQNSGVNDNPYGMSSFHDMLARNAFGNFRQMLEEVTLHPAMGVYLSHLGNQKESTRTVNGQVSTQLPDENYARESMQLFTIGLWQLNADGTQRLDANGKPVPTYGQREILGMAKVLTGFSWGHCSNTDTGCFRGWRNSDANDPNQNRWRVPMQVYPQFHSTSEKVIVGEVIPSGGTAQTDLKAALDALFRNPNVGPFFSKQMIQRLVTSNPSPAYVQRVVSKFNNNGKGFRGDMKAVIQAVLLDPEALDLTRINDSRFGKLREPVVRYAQILRAFKGRAPSGYFRLYSVADIRQGIGENFYYAPSVFGYYRPEFSTPGLRANGMVAPEFQITHEATVSSGSQGFDSLVRMTSMPTQWADGVALDYSSFLPDATNPQRLVDRMNLLLTANTLSPSTRTTLISMLNSMPSSGEYQRLDRIRRTLWVISMSPDFMVQK